MAQNTEHMHHCLHCNQPCVEDAIFCDECRASLLKRQQPSGLAQSERTTQPARDLDSTRKPFPARPRAMLPVFIMLGAIALVAGGILLSTNVMRHHTRSLTDMAAISGTSVVFSPVSGTGRGTGTSSSSPGTTTPGAGTPTPAAGTTTPGAGTPTPVSVPTSTPSPPTSCVLQAAPTHLSFMATILQPDPPGQSITLKTTGNCGKPVTWKATADSSWIQFSSTTGSDNGSGSSVTVYAHSNKIVGAYTAHITVTAVDSSGITVQGSPQTVSVTLTVVG